MRVGMPSDTGQNPAPKRAHSGALPLLSLASVGMAWCSFQEFRVPYLPGESDTGIFGGNSNWRGCNRSRKAGGERTNQTKTADREGSQQS